MAMFSMITLVLSKLSLVFILNYGQILPMIFFFDILNALVDDLSKLSVDLGNSIIREVTSEEVCSALIDIPAGKSSGPDGFNVEFYQFFWNEIGSHLVSAIK